jgi:hypothetical protein
MVLMNGPKRVRNIASITNLPTCGGNKKAGTGPKVSGQHAPAYSYRRAPQTVPLLCIGNTTNQVQPGVFVRARN